MSNSPLRRWEREVDLVVIGSGAAGLAGAISAAAHGAEVLVLERTARLGGTSAVSGGVPWIPNNHHMHEVGVSDSPEEALDYLRSLSLGRMDDELIETFVETGPQVIRFLEERTELKFRALRIPDYHPEFPGGKAGRSLTPQLFPGGRLGEWRGKLRPAPHFPIPTTMADFDDGVDLLDPAIVGERLMNDMLGCGNALMAGLIKSAIDHGVSFLTEARARHLVVEDGVVVGVEADHAGDPVAIRARRGVLIASGGFEWNDGLAVDLLRGPMEGAVSPPFNEGDGLLMALEAGSAVGNLGEAWWMPVVQIPEEEYEGHQLSRLTAVERCSPGSIMVNGAGRRFVNEAHNYNDVGRAFHDFDPVSFRFRNVPAWLILHQGYMDRYPFLTVYPGDPIPDWLACAPTLRELADQVGIDADGLETTVAQFNENARRGVDPEFRRGESAYDVFYGDSARTGAARSLGPLDQGPFYACRIGPGALGTKGGPKINRDAQVLAATGGTIPGLYAAGNAAASPMGMAYPGAGATIGSALTFGYIAGVNVATLHNSR